MSALLANIHPDARLGVGVVVEPFATIGADVEIGDGTWVGPNSVIMDGARIGANCRIFPGAVVSAIPQDLKFKGEKTIATVGDNTTVRECVTINRGTADRWETRVGSNCLLMAYVHVAHDCFVGNNVILANSVNLAGHIDVDDHAILEGMVAVQQFVRIGAHAFIAGATLVRKSVPPFVRAAREPISYVGVNTVGLKRRGFSDDQVREIEDVYRHLFVKNDHLGKAMESATEVLAPSAVRDEILAFIRAADKGVIKGL